MRAAAVWCLATLAVGSAEHRFGWVHMPKCGTSFGTSLAHVANASLPAGAGMRDCRVHTCSSDILEKDFIARYPYERWFAHVFWTKPSGNFGDHHTLSATSGWEQYRGRLVGMFREPLDRAWSAYRHFGEWHFDQQGASSGSSSSRRSGGSDHFEWYAQRIRGSATTMLSGQRHNGLECLVKGFPCDQAMVPDVDTAIARLDDFAFVGLVSRWAESICLLHAMHGGACHAVEFENARPGNASLAATGSASSRVVVGPPLASAATADPYDERLYVAVAARFESDLAKHGVSRVRCERNGCWPGHTADNSTVSASVRAA